MNKDNIRFHPTESKMRKDTHNFKVPRYINDRFYKTINKLIKERPDLHEDLIRANRIFVSNILNKKLEIIFHDISDNNEVEKYLNYFGTPQTSDRLQKMITSNKTYMIDWIINKYAQDYKLKLSIGNVMIAVMLRFVEDDGFDIPN